MTQPVSKPTVAPADQDEVYRASAPVDWWAYRKCSQVCRAAIGEPCFALSGKVVDGRPDGVKTYLPKPHAARKMRTRKPAFSRAPLAR